MAYKVEIAVEYPASGYTSVSLKEGNNRLHTFITYSKLNIKQLASILTSNGKIKNYKAYDKKDKMKAITEYLGCTPSKFCNVFNGVMYETYIKSLDSDPIMKQYRQMLGFGRWGISKKSIILLHKHKQQLKQVYKDCIVNISPFVLKTGKTPKELKEQFGKGLWKKLCKNSFSRNKLICNYFDAHSEVWYLDKLNTIPTTILEHSGTWSIGLDYFIKNFKGEWKHGSTRRKVVDTYNDTLQMANRLGEKFNHNWSFEVIQKKHEDFTESISQRRYSKDRFKSLTGVNVESVSSDNYVAVLLQSPFDLYKEGTSMRHCVATYTWDVENGRYLVYAVSDKKGNKHSTIGISIEDKQYSLQQHYMFANKPVEEQEVIALAERVVFELNKEVL